MASAFEKYMSLETVQMVIQEAGYKIDYKELRLVSKYLRDELSTRFTLTFNKNSKTLTSEQRLVKYKNINVIGNSWKLTEEKLTPPPRIKLLKGYLARKINFGNCKKHELTPFPSGNCINVIIGSGSDLDQKEILKFLVENGGLKPFISIFQWKLLPGCYIWLPHADEFPEVDKMGCRIRVYAYQKSLFTVGPKTVTFNVSNNNYYFAKLQIRK